MRRWLAVSSLLLLSLSRPAPADSPVARWAHGAWWEVQIEHQTWHSGTPRVGWTPSFRLRFEVTRGDEAVQVEVTTIPENRFKERLVLRYSPEGELLSAQIVDPERVTELGSAGGFGVFGMLGREAFQLSRTPEPNAGGLQFVRVPMDATGGTAQVWGSDRTWWAQYETAEGVPQRATLTDSSWRQPRAGNSTITTGSGAGSLGPGLGPEAIPAAPTGASETVMPVLPGSGPKVEILPAPPVLEGNPSSGGLGKSDPAAAEKPTEATAPADSTEKENPSEETANSPTSPKGEVAQPATPSPGNAEGKNSTTPAKKPAKAKPAPKKPAKAKPAPKKPVKAKGWAVSKKG